MTDWLSRLQEVFGERTPGPYEDHVSDSFGMFWEVTAPPHEDLKSTTAGEYHPVAMRMRSGDAEFLATCDSIGDELLAVIVAAMGIPEQPSAAHRLRTPGYKELSEAFAALKAKVEASK